MFEVVRELRRVEPRAPRTRCRQSTVWQDGRAGYVGAYREGFVPTVLMRLAEEIRKRWGAFQAKVSPPEDQPDSALWGANTMDLEARGRLAAEFNWPDNILSAISLVRIFRLPHDMSPIRAHF